TDLGPLCPPPCPANSTKSTQCLYYLQESHKEEVCGPDLGPERRRDVLHGLRMRHCCEHAVDQALPEDAFNGGKACRDMLDTLIKADDLASRIACGHAQVLTRYDCGQTYSIAHRCHRCKQAYRRWVCSYLVPHFTRADERVRPCLSVCQDVEQQCPYLLPGDWTNQTVPPGETAHPTPQYAGEPTFLCLDPNIPETGEQRLNSSRGDEDCCYTHCGSPGRGGSGTAEVLNVCEHCPGRPKKKKKKNNANGSNVTTKSTTAAARGAAAARTCNKVSLLWTAWIISITLIEHKETIYNTLQCLLVLCATSVRTTLLLLLLMTKWTKTKCGTCS
ncbi:transmembrane protein FAM155B, partial [Tribolium madens]|uniref:transmembrane protein FAM155B n=1 Tax=Tribolium madens TaxID=41895 RepID=UPI001CF72920